jgi:hypothetical protein
MRQAIDVEVSVDGASVDTARVRLLPAIIRPGDTLTEYLPVRLGATAAHAGQAQVSMHVSGAVDLSTSGVIQILDLPNSAQKTGLMATVTSVQLPTTIHANSTVEINYVARNAGRATWLPQTGAPAGAVGVAVRGWIGADEQPVLVNGAALSSIATHVDASVNPGQQVALTLVARTPPTPGQYQIVLDMLSENVSWFEDLNGGARTVVPVVVDN